MKHFADHISCAVLLPDYRMWLLQKLLSQTVSGSWHDRSAMRGARLHCCRLHVSRCFYGRMLEGAELAGRHPATGFKGFIYLNGSVEKARGPEPP
ncbi:hypothetical protein [Nitrobacter hamburgensis]|uniref:hypothetical protein n=1 Tax=Nitrobacter hamburgensis TaxID=912 RepID=UPI0012EDA526|nr:hypothetical protein [Nitrobacter hamburgensis]